ADTDAIPPMPPFTKTYGFYVLMGGLAVNVVHLHDYLQDVVLTPNGVLELARKGHFFHVSDAYINDKSKANLLAKVKYYCPLNIALSPNDVRRWQLAGAALRKELPITVSHQNEKPLLNFESSGGSSRGAYFAVKRGLIGLTAPYEDEMENAYWRKPRDYKQCSVWVRASMITA
ncbi:MAG: hypothetical protein LQ349_002796, partial [Xanthoria aureola]